MKPMNEETLVVDRSVPGATMSAGVPRPGSALPRLLVGVPAHGAIDLARHLAVHGPTPVLSQPRRRRSESPLIELIAHAGLHGRGGASFPTATKLRALAGSRKRAIVVVNAAEGEPASRKDRTLLQSSPHLVLDGAQLTAAAIGADALIVCVRADAHASLTAAEQALTERRDLATDAAHMCVSAVPDRYVSGHETALVNHLNGGPAIPMFTPPMVFQRGVQHRPTLVANAETLAHVALIARHGPDWFRELGTSSQPGSALVTLTGPVAHPGVYEIAYGASLSSLIDAAGGVTAAPRALLIGGYSGSWIDGRLLTEAALSDEHLAPYGASFGAGVVLLLSEHACPIAETARVTRWLAGQSAGQCGPCIHGLDAIASALEGIVGGVPQSDASAQDDARERIARLAALVRRRGACGHPDGVAQFVTSALDAFAPELLDHARHGPCERCEHTPELPLPVVTRVQRPRVRASVRPPRSAREQARPKRFPREPLRPR